MEKIRNVRIRARDNESWGNHKESTGNEVEMVWACDEKRGTLRMKEGNGNESTGEKEERKTYDKIVGQSKGGHQREGNVG